MTDYAVALQQLTDLELAEAYVDYMDDTGSCWFTDIFWEANRRGLSLTDLEEIHSKQFDPPCSLDS